MINPSQLLIGSWVQDHLGRTLVISGLKDGYVYLLLSNGEKIRYHEKTISPIPLTTDWLERAGYQNVTETWYTEPCYALSIGGETFYYWPTEQKLYWDEVFLRKLDAVHELQLLMAGLGHPLTFDK